MGQAHLQTGLRLNAAIGPLQEPFYRVHRLISYVHFFCHLPYAEIFRGELVAFARSGFP